MESNKLLTGLWVEAKLKELDLAAISYYYIQKGNHASGLVMLKLNPPGGPCKLITQQRNFETNQLEWTNVLNKEIWGETEADDYIRRSISRDPDLWVIEVESNENPFT